MIKVWNTHLVHISRDANPYHCLPADDSISSKFQADISDVRGDDWNWHGGHCLNSSH